jgi:hypothetical protein
MSNEKPLLVSLGLDHASRMVVVLRSTVSTLDGSAVPCDVAEYIVACAGKAGWDLAMALACRFCGVVKAG